MSHCLPGQPYGLPSEGSLVNTLVEDTLLKFDLRWDRPSKPGPLQLRCSVFAPRPPREGGCGEGEWISCQSRKPGAAHPGKKRINEGRGTRGHADCGQRDTSPQRRCAKSLGGGVGGTWGHADVVQRDTSPPQDDVQGYGAYPKKRLCSASGVLLQRYFLTASESDLPSLSISVGRGREDYCVFLSNGERTVRTERCFALACRESKVEDGPC